MFQLCNRRGCTSEADELENTEGIHILNTGPENICNKEIVRTSDVFFRTCSGADSEMIASAGKFDSEMMASAGKFDPIVIDEAGQSTKPVTMIPLSKYLGPSTALLIIGDKRQLGPKTISQDADVRTVLGTLLMERLSARREISSCAATESLFLSGQYHMYSKSAAFVRQPFCRGILHSRRSGSESGLKFLRDK
jgi:AAA domain